MKMLKNILYIILLLIICNRTFAQYLLNGDFEINSAVSDMVNLTNSQYESLMTNSFAFGNYNGGGPNGGNMDIITSSNYYYCGPPAQSGNWFVALTSGGTDAISLALSSPLIAGKNYCIIFYDRSCSPYQPGSPIQIGVSNVNNNFGNLVYTAPFPLYNGGWIQRTFSFTAPISALYITVRCGGINGAIAPWTQIDNLILCSTNLGNDTTLCQGETLTLDATASNATYLWQDNSTNPTFTVTQQGIYWVEVTANNCNTRDTINVNYNPLPTVTFTTDLQSGCTPLCVSFNNTTFNTSTVNWNFGDGNSGTEAAITHCYPDPGTYDVTLTVIDNNGCTNSLLAPDLIKVFPNPIANFTMTPPYVAQIYSTVFFYDHSSETVDWSWNFGDIPHATSTAKNPTFSYKEIGAYTVNLIVKSDEGCRDTISHTIIIESEFSLYIPNAFTPDNDGVNDFFSPKGAEFSSFEMEIYSRWGEKMYHTSDIDKPWNGTIKGETEVVQQDVYIYKIQVKDFKDETHYYVGNVTLIR